MFLVVFVTLVISVIGLFAQVVALQAAQIASTQTGLAQSMQVWHASAVTAAQNTPPTNISSGSTPCGLTSNTSGLSVSGCTAGGDAVQASDRLPPGVSNTTAPPFISIAYVTPSIPVTRYVLTYATTDGKGNLYYGTTSNLSGFTQGDLLRQLNHISGRNFYGTVTSAGTLTVQPNAMNSTQLTYAVPTNTAIVPVGSIGMISAAQ